MNDNAAQVNQMDIEGANQLAVILIREVIDVVVEAMVVNNDNEPGADDSDDDSMNELDDEDDENILMERRQLHRILNYIETTVHAYDAEEFQSHFRIKREYVYTLIGQFGQSNYLINNEPQGNAITHEKAFLLTLWYLANNETFRQISDRFDVTRSSSHRVLQQTLNFITSLADEFIQWPHTLEEKQEISDGFRDLQGIDGVIGAIDGTHIRIIRPQENQRDYYNRKKYHSILVQVISTSDKRIIDAYIGEPGSMHDARMLRRSPIYEIAQENPDFFGQFCVLGDSAYTNLPWLVTPFRDNGALTPEQHEFNYRHSATRVKIENTFSDPKNVLRRLKKFNNLIMEIVLNCVMASCILHNIRLLVRDDDSDEEPSSESDDSESETDSDTDVDTDPEEDENEDDNRDANVPNRRQRMFNEMFPEEDRG